MKFKSLMRRKSRVHKHDEKSLREMDRRISTDIQNGSFKAVPRAPGRAAASGHDSQRLWSFRSPSSEPSTSTRPTTTTTTTAPGYYSVIGMRNYDGVLRTLDTYIPGPGLGPYPVEALPRGGDLYPWLQYR